MSSLNYSVSIIALGLLVPPMAQAQDQANPRGEARRDQAGQADSSQGQGRGQMMNPEARVQQLDRVVTLTPDQKTKVEAIYTKAQEEMRAMMRDGGGDQQANREKMMATMQSTRDQVRAVLTDEQKTKFDAMPQGRGRGEGRSKEGAGSDGAAKDGAGRENRGKKKA